MLQRIQKGFERRLRKLITKRHPVVHTIQEHQWSIGIYQGQDPFSLLPCRCGENPVLTAEKVSDVPAAFVADPFMTRHKDLWYMFFEVVNRRTGKGEIGLARSKNLYEWQYDRIVLAEPFHLSYPYVFEFNGDYFMVPETHKAQSVRLYKAMDFPWKWKFVREMMKGAYFADASLLHYDNRWWMFVETNPELKHDTLRLFSAPDLFSRWDEHVKSPILVGDPHAARPAGRLIWSEGHLIRFAQNCDPVYGADVRAFRVTDLSVDDYEESQVGEAPILAGSGHGWNSTGMHHVDAHRHGSSWVACVDGFRWKEVKVSR